MTFMQITIINVFNALIFCIKEISK